MAYNSRPAYFHHNHSHQCPPPHHHAGQGGFYPQHEPSGYPLFQQGPPAPMGGVLPPPPSSSSYGHNHFHQHQPQHSQQTYSRHPTPPRHPEPMSCGGMTFLPTKTATNFPAHGGQLPARPAEPSTIRPAQLGSQPWTNERRPRGDAPVVAPPAPAGVDDSPASEIPVVAEDEVVSDTSSVNLNDTFTRDPQEAKAKRQARRLARRQEKVAQRVQKQPSTNTPADPWAEWSVSTPGNSPNQQPEPAAALSAPTTSSPVMWSYAPPNTAATSANTTCMPTPYMSTKNSPLQDALSMPPPFALPLPIAPAVPVPPAPTAELTPFQLPPAATMAPTTETKMEEEKPQPLSYLAAVGGGKTKSVTQWLSQSQSEPSTKPASVTQTPAQKPTPTRPGALDVHELETSLLAERTTATTPAKRSDTSPNPEEEQGRFKTHRYRGPRHCRACRFHSKSLHAQVVLTRDPNLRYKLDMHCKVCNETFEKCVDDKEWQGLWERHCKSSVHYRNALEESPAGKGRDRTTATPAVPAPRSSTTVTAARTSSDSRNGGANFNKLESTPGHQLAYVSASKANEATPDRKIIFGSNLPEPATTRMTTTRKVPTTDSSSNKVSTSNQKSILGSFTVDADPIAETSASVTTKHPQHGAIQKPRMNAEQVDLMEEDDEEVVVFMPVF